MTTPDRPRRRILVIDDEEPLARMVANYLRRDGFAVEVALDGPTGVALARRLDPDVMILDLGLPVLDGVQVCRQVRQFTDAYVLMLTARAEEADKLAGLAAGADDYLTKPFSPRELVARVHVLLRRPRRKGPDRAVQVFGPLMIDVVAREVRLDGQEVEVTRTEFDVLSALAARPREALSRTQLIEAVWGTGWVGDEHLVDVHVGHLRRKLGDDASAPRFVRTVRGVGYRMGSGMDNRA